MCVFVLDDVFLNTRVLPCRYMTHESMPQLVMLVCAGMTAVGVGSCMALQSIEDLEKQGVPESPAADTSAGTLQETLLDANGQSSTTYGTRGNIQEK
jgi:hypothetical protein